MTDPENLPSESWIHCAIFKACVMYCSSKVVKRKIYFPQIHDIKTQNKFKEYICDSAIIIENRIVNPGWSKFLMYILKRFSVISHTSLA